MKAIYLDNSATTALSEGVKTRMREVMEVYGNPSSLHFLGNAAHEVFHIPRSVHPTMSLSFLSLAVIPHLRVTDLGLFDVDAFALTTIEPKA